MKNTNNSTARTRRTSWEGGAEGKGEGDEGRE